MTAQRPTSPKEWKKKTQEPVELPSGFYMRIRKMSMTHLLAAGKLPNSLIGMVQGSVDRGTGKSQDTPDLDKVMDDVLDDPKKLREMAEFMDDLLVMVAVEPQVYPVPKDPKKKRDDDLLYADEVDELDKSFIFQLVSGGPADLAQFRETASANVAAVLGREDVELPAVGAAASEG